MHFLVQIELKQSVRGRFLSKHLWHFLMDVLVKNREIPRKITGVLYEKNKLSETIQRHKGDAVVYPMLIDEIMIVRLCLYS